MAEAWDFGRGLAGYAWRTPGAHANLLLTHGFAEYAERYVAHYHSLVPKLNALGFDVYGWDMAGHGRSPGARGVADLRKAVADHRAARAKLNDKPLFVFGHSLGGLVTAASVAEDQDGVAGVVLSAPALLISAPAHLRAIADVNRVVGDNAALLLNARKRNWQIFNRRSFDPHQRTANAGCVCRQVVANLFATQVVCKVPRLKVRVRRKGDPLRRGNFLMFGEGPDSPCAVDSRIDLAKQYGAGIDDLLVGTDLATSNNFRLFAVEGGDAV